MKLTLRFDILGVDLGGININIDMPENDTPTPVPGPIAKAAKRVTWPFVKAVFQ